MTREGAKKRLLLQEQAMSPTTGDFAMRANVVCENAKEWSSWMKKSGKTIGYESLMQKADLFRTLNFLHGTAGYCISVNPINLPGKGREIMQGKYTLVYIRKSLFKRVSLVSLEVRTFVCCV
jgi:hypothetical protein